LTEGHHSNFTVPRQEHSEKEMELKPKVVSNPFRWKGTRYHGLYSMLRAVRQKLNLLAEEIGLDLVQQESGEVTFHYTQVDPNMNTEQYRIYETIILHHIKHVQNIQEYSRLSRTSPQDFFKSQLMSEREIYLAKGEEGHLRYLQELAILVITGFFILDPLFMTCKNILVCQIPRVMFYTWEFQLPTWVVVTVPTFSLLLGHKMIFNFQNYQTILSTMEKTRSLKRVAESGPHPKEFAYKRLKATYANIEECDLQSQAISLGLEIERDMSQQPSTEEIKRVTSQPLPEKSLAIYQEPEALHLKSVNDMALARDNSFYLKLPVFEQLSTSHLPSRADKVSRQESVFTSSNQDTSSVLYGIMSSLLGGYVQEKSLTYPINDLSV